MRIPARYVAGNLIFNLDGATWALLRVDPPTYGRMPRKEKLAWHSRVAAALMSLPAESMILGVAQPVEPATIVSAMVAGVDVRANPRWAEVALDTLDTLAEAKINARAHYVAVCLPSPAGAGRVSLSMGAAMARMGQRFRLPAPPVSPRALRAARAQADDLCRPLASFLGAERVHPASEGEIEWLYARASLRGLDTPTLEEFSAGAPTRLSAARLAAVGESVIFEGGSDDDEDRPRHRRYVSVVGEAGVSYQCFAVLSHMPSQFTYPDGKGELLARLNDFPVPVDWVVRIRPKANAAAQLAITGQIRQLSGQFEEYEGDLAGAPESLSDAIETMRGEVARLNASPSTPECQVTIAVAMGAADLRTLEENVTRLRSFLEANEYKLPRPTGDQGSLWEAFLPGSTLPPVADDYAQFLLPSDIAGCAPFAGSALGDDQGDLLGLNIDAGGRPVLFWAGTGPNTAPPNGPKSGSIGIFGRLGGGKSYLIKRIVTATVEMGGRAVVTDRTPMGEYVRLAAALELGGHSAQVIDLGPNAKVCLDPLLVFEGEDRIRYGAGFLTLLTGTPPTDPQGALLDKAVRRVAAVPGGRLSDVPEELRLIGETNAAFAEAAATVALKVEVFTEGALARLVFGDGAPVSLRADYSVFHAPNLDLPGREALAERRQLMPEQVFSSALLYLVTAIARSVAFSERDRFSLIAQDEGYVLSSSPQGQELLDVILRDGRKHNAALIFASHHPDDLAPRLQELLGSRFLFRMDRNAARAGLAFMGMEPSEANVDDIEEASRQVGQCLYRDLAGRLGLLHVLQPRTPELREAFDTGLTHVRREAAAGRPGSRRRRAPVEA